MIGTNAYIHSCILIQTKTIRRSNLVLLVVTLTNLTLLLECLLET